MSRGFVFGRLLFVAKERIIEKGAQLKIIFSAIQTAMLSTVIHFTIQTLDVCIPEACKEQSRSDLWNLRLCFGDGSVVFHRWIETRKNWIKRVTGKTMLTH